MDFARVETEFRRLKGQFERGALTEAEFKAQLEELMIEDEQGRWWILGYETGQWYVHDGEKWVPQEPPQAAPGPPPAQPQHLRTADLTPDAQPGPTTAALSKPKLGLLRRPVPGRIIFGIVLLGIVLLGIYLFRPAELVWGAVGAVILIVAGAAIFSNFLFRRRK